VAVGGVVGHPVGGYQAETTVEVKQAGGRLLVKLGLSQLVSCILPGEDTVLDPVLFRF